MTPRLFIPVGSMNPTDAASGAETDVFGLAAAAFNMPALDVKKFASQDFSQSLVNSNVMQSLLSRVKLDGLGSLDENTLLRLLLKKVADYQTMVDSNHMDPMTIVATLLSTIVSESHFNPHAISGVVSEAGNAKIAEDPDKYFKQYSNSAKGIVQFIPSTYKLMSTYKGPVHDSIVNDNEVMRFISENDPDLYNMVKLGKHYAKMTGNIASQIIPSIKALSYNIDIISKDWLWLGDKGWVPKRDTVKQSVTDLWALYPAAQFDKDLGFALLYTVYHADGQPSLYKSPPVFHHGLRYAQSVELVGYLLQDPDFISHPQLKKII